jgi:hypothetical protein
MKLTLTLLAFVASVIAAPIAAPDAQGTYATYGKLPL